MSNTEIKAEVKRLIDDARLSLKRLRDENIIPDCDVFKLTYILGDTAEAHGAAVILSKISPGDTEADSMRIKATEIHTKAFRERDRFTNECECKRNININQKSK